MKTKRSYIEYRLESGAVIEVSVVKGKVDFQLYRQLKNQQLELFGDTVLTKEEAKELASILQELANG
jgi:hypothetical protein